MSVEWKSRVTNPWTETDTDTISTFPSTFSFLDRETEDINLHGDSHFSSPLLHVTSLTVNSSAVVTDGVHVHW